MDVIGIIPARYQSSRFPGKALADINGKPMIQHVFERSHRVADLKRLVVATDDLRIIRAVESFGGEAIMTSVDHPSGTDRIAEACRLMQIADDAIVVNIQGDEPLLESGMVRQLIEALRESPDCPMATLAYRSGSEKEFKDPNVVKVVVDNEGKALYFSRAPIPHLRDRVEGSFTFLKHLGFYAYRHSFLQTFTKLSEGMLEKIEKLEQLRAIEHGFAIRVTLSPVETHGVDTPEDLARLLELWQA